MWRNIKMVSIIIYIVVSWHYMMWKEKVMNRRNKETGFPSNEIQACEQHDLFMSDEETAKYSDRITTFVVVAAVALFIFFLVIFAGPADAQEKPKVRHANFFACNTAEQIETTIDILLTDPEITVDEMEVMITTQYGKDQCNLVDVLFVLGDTIKVLPYVNDMTVEILEIAIIEYHVDATRLRLGKPITQYIFRPIDAPIDQGA